MSDEMPTNGGRFAFEAASAMDIVMEMEIESIHINRHHINKKT